MSGERDAFGRTTGAGASPPAAAPAPRRAASSPPGQAFRVLLLLVLLLAAGAAVWGTMRAAADWADRDQNAIEFALDRDPLGPQSLLRTDPLRRALDRVQARLRRGDRVAYLTISPEQLTATVADARDQRRWVTAQASGRVRETDLETTEEAPGFALDRLDVAPMTRAVAARMRALAPYAREPTASVATDTETGAVEGWTISVHGVRKRDELLTIDRKGRVR
ncbi:hypothetical protein [Patulibacter sp. SYSU D01012]|uniref:hypothetical protein n=1 Tax=Patulibacter sp. SYSU D01012 TaxID=2817381 RepID=UPI001B315C9E|nr:hypothetical protein [Patulibacter sp. SYSU D01012]